MTSRIYDELPCGCLVSRDGGRGFMSCYSVDCVFLEYAKKHKICPYCKECISCYEGKGGNTC